MSADSSSVPPPGEQAVPVAGFDPAGEPEVHVLPDGALSVIFDCLPPSDAADHEEEHFSRFDRHLEQAVGVSVVREDRERFLIPTPAADTLERLRYYLQTCRREPGPRGSAKPGIRGALNESLGAVLTRGGFRLRKKQEAFVRSIPGGRQLLLVALTERGEYSDFSLVLGIRLDAVETIANKYSNVRRQYQADSLTTLTQLEHFGLEPSPGIGVRIPVAGPGQVSAAVERLTPLLQDQILPFFERYQDVASLNGALHPPTPAAAEEGGRRGWLAGLLRGRPKGPVPTAPADPWAQWRAERRAFDSTKHPHRGMRGAVVAHLAGDSRFDVLVEGYRRELREYPEPDRQRFEELVRHLKG